MRASHRFFWLWCAGLFLAGMSFGAIEVAETLFVDLTAQDDTAGDDEWINNGTLGTEGGNFTRIGAPYVEEFDVGTGTPVRAVTFNGSTDAYKCLVNAPAGLTGLDPTRSIEVWAYNMAANDEETMVAWGHRGGGDGTNMSFNYGVNATWGAVGHWGWTDLPWKPGGGCPDVGKWHHLAYTYDGTTTRVYSDGAFWNSEVLGAGTVNTWPDTPIVLAAQILDATGAVGFEAYAASLSIARVRVHDGVLSDAQILNNFNAERDFFGITGEPPVFTSVPMEGQFLDGDATYTAPVGVAGIPLPDLIVLAPAGATVTAAGGGYFTVTYTLPVPSPASFVVSVRASNTLGQQDASWTVTRKSLPPAGTLAVAGELFVSLDARDDTAGDDVWINNGTLDDFARVGDAVKEDVAGVTAVNFNKLGQTDAYQCLENAPDGLVGLNATRSIEVWAFNQAIADEETLVAWSHRGGGAGTNMSFNYGLNGAYGAVGHWDVPDLGWVNTGGAPAAGRWHHLVYTYDGTTTRVYADGVLWNSEYVGPGVINTYAGTPIVLASQIEADGFTLTPTLRGTLALARVRVHDGVLAEAEVLHNYTTEKDDFGLPGFANVPASDIAYAGDPTIPYQYKLIVSGTPPLLFPLIEPAGATITEDGLYTYTIPTPAPASFTVRVRVANVMGTSEATWPVEVRQLPPAGVLAEAGEVLVRLDAGNDTAGDDEWINEGTLVGPAGEDSNFLRIGMAFKEEVAGAQAVTFNATGPVGDAYQCKVLAPEGITGVDPTRTIEAWVYNPAVAAEETVLSWSRRGGPCGTNMSFNYGYDGYFGAVGHWCHDPGPDMGWTDDGIAPAGGQWHYLVYTYDGSTTRVYADGVLSNSEYLGPGAINTYADTPIVLAAQWDGVGAMNIALGGTLSIARVRIHDGVLAPAQIAHNWNVERADFGLSDSAPVFTSAPSAGYFYDGDIEYTAAVYAFGIPAPAYEVVLPAGATITAQGLFTYTIPAPAPASFTVTVRAVNAAGSAQASWVVSKAAGAALAKGPVHRYSFAADASDSIGGADGVPYGAVTFAAGQAVLGNTGAEASNAVDPFPDPANPDKLPPGAYVDLPNGIISGLGDNATFEAWMTWNGPSTSYWQRIFDFGTANAGEDYSGGGDMSNYIFLTPLSGGNTMRFGYREGLSMTERWIETAVPPIGAETHVAVVWNGDDTTAQLFVDGKRAAEDTATHIPLGTLPDVSNWLGRSLWPDAMFNGTYNEFRIYDYALSAFEVLGNFQAGADTVTAGEITTIYVLMGNVNTDQKVDIADAIALLGYLFGGGTKPPPVCAKGADANDDNKLDIADAIKILGYLFSQQSMLAPDHSTVTAAVNTCKGYAADGVDAFDGKPYFPAQVSGLPPCASQCQ